MKKRLKTYNVLQIIFMYVMVIILILSAMGIYLYSFLVKTVYSDFLSGNKQHLSAIINQHENDMQIADNIVTQIGLMNETTQFHLSENPENAEELKKTLKGYTTVSQFFDLLFYHYHEDTFFFHYLSSVNEELLKEQGIEFGSMSAEEFVELAKEITLKTKFFQEQTLGGVWLKNYLSDTNYVIFMRTIPSNLKSTLIFMVPGSYYDELLADATDDRRVDFLKFEDQIIVQRGNVEITEEDMGLLLQTESETEIYLGEDIFQKEVTVGAEEFLLTLQKGKSGILYGTMQSLEIYQDKVMMEQWTIWLIMMICMLISAIIIVFTSKGFVDKVKSLNGLLNEDSIYDLNRIESGIQTLVTTYRESEKESIELKKTRFIRNFIRGDFAEKEEAVEEAEKAKLNINYEIYLVVLLRSREITDENRAYTDMLEMIEHKINLEGYGIHLISNNQNLFVLFGDKIEDIEEGLRNIFEIGKAYSHDCVVACSDYHKDFSEISKAYLESVNAFDNYLLLDNSRVIRFSDVVHKEYVSMLPDSYLQRLKQAIRIGDKNVVDSTVKDICSKLDSEKVSLYSFRIFYNDIIHILLSEWKGKEDQFDDFYNVFTISKCLNLQEFGELLCEVCYRIIDGYSGKTINISRIVEKAVSYMKENYQNAELTMNSLAEHLGVSAVTLSVEFKNEMDIKPSDYLSNLRMEKAKELLRNSDMRIREISLSVGYEDDRVFMRRFKKYTGMTPSEYRIG